MINKEGSSSTVDWIKAFKKMNAIKLLYKGGSVFWVKAIVCGFKGRPA
jgi:hypothetical protein